MGEKIKRFTKKELKWQFCIKTFAHIVYSDLFQIIRFISAHHLKNHTFFVCCSKETKKMWFLIFIPLSQVAFIEDIEYNMCRCFYLDILPRLKSWDSLYLLSITTVYKRDIAEIFEVYRLWAFVSYCYSQKLKTVDSTCQAKGLCLNLFVYF